MRRAICCLLLLGLSTVLADAQQKLSGVKRFPQTSKLESTFLAFQTSGDVWRWDSDRRRARSPLSYQLVDEIMLLPDSDHQPSRSTVDFADELTGALLGKTMTNAQAQMLEQSINAILHSTGAIFVSASQFRETLAGIGVDAGKAKIITRYFIAIGEEVRGPDDLGL
jgi:hypothetical protein